MASAGTWRRALSWASAFTTHAAALALGVALTFEMAVRLTALPDLSRLSSTSQIVTASNGTPLWFFLASDQRFRLATDPTDVDPDYLALLLKYEDKRFFSHNGLDVLGVMRAAVQAVRHRRVLSGASTLTMQVVRMIAPRRPGTFSKLEQVLGALKLERFYSKEEILSAYLTLAPFGGNIEGVRAASLAYFRKEPKLLTIEQCALLVAVPQSPEARRPDRHWHAAGSALNRVLRTASSGSTGLSARTLARLDTFSRAVALVRSPLNALAPHFAARVRRSSEGHEYITTLIEHRLQRAVQTIGQRALQAWEPDVSVAILVVRNRDAAVITYVGGLGYSDRQAAGYVDLVQAVRSPGSALKPFIYAMAFEDLIVHPDTIVTDEPIAIDGYSPQNAEGIYVGDISVRGALTRSINTTAVLLLSSLGPDRFAARLAETGAPLALPTTDKIGLAVALGGAGISLEKLTWLYTAFAREGALLPLRFKASDPIGVPRRLISAAAAIATADILADIGPPPAFARRLSQNGGRRIGFKTGTSYGFRDAWALGFDKDHTVGVWIGRPDGAPHLGAYGISAAAPIMLRVFDQLPLPKHDVAWSKTDLGSLASPRGLPTRLARFEAPGQLSSTLKVSFPVDGSRISRAGQRHRSASIPLVAAGGVPPFHWVISGEPQPPQERPEFPWMPSGTGQFDVMVVDGDGRSATSSFWLE